MSPFYFALARYNTDGSPDLGFGSGGQVRTAFFDDAVYSQAQSLAVQGDGKIVVAGNAYNQSLLSSVFAVVRYNPDGSLDSGFGSGGKAAASFLATASCPWRSDDYGNSVVLDGNGKIVVAGYSDCSTVNYVTQTYTFDVARFNTDGTLDSTFGASGRVVTALGSGVDGAGYSAAVQSDGKIVVGGDAFNQSGFPRSTDMALVRYNSDGSLDTGFGAGGKVITSFEVSSVHADSNLRSLALQVDGKIVAGGDQALVRYNNDGSLDSGFGDGGTFRTAFDTGLLYSNISSLAVRSDGKIVVGGSAGNDMFVDLALARFNSDGSLDTGFGSGGWVTTGPVHDVWEGTSLALQSDGRIVLAGYKYAQDFLVARFLGTDCGNGEQEPGEPCDDGNAINGDGCDNNCTVTACGNGILTAGEECDDGNTTSGDGCSDTCQVEICFTCAGTPSVCSPKCVAADQCHQGVCDSGTGACSYPSKSDGSPCNDGDGCPADTCEAGVCQPVSCPNVDAVVLPGKPLNVKIATGKTAVKKTLGITVRNADTADRTISLSVDGSGCPAGVAGSPDFVPKTPAADSSILVPAGKTKQAKLPLTINSTDFDSFNFKAPTRCTLVLTASAVVSGGNNDPTPDNNVAVVELNIVDKNDPEHTTTTTHETTIKSASPTTLNIKPGNSSATKTLKAVVGNADYRPTAETPGDPITLSASTTCSGLTLGAPICDAKTSSSTVTVPGGKTKTCKLTATADGTQITTGNPKSPQRCTVTLTATGPTNPEVSPLDGSNNSTELVLDVLDKND